MKRMMTKSEGYLLAEAFCGSVTGLFRNKRIIRLLETAGMNTIRGIYQLGDAKLTEHNGFHDEDIRHVLSKLKKAGFRGISDDGSESFWFDRRYDATDIFHDVGFDEGMVHGFKKGVERTIRCHFVEYRGKKSALPWLKWLSGELRSAVEGGKEWYIPRLRAEDADLPGLFLKEDGISFPAASIAESIAPEVSCGHTGLSLGLMGENFLLGGVEYHGDIELDYRTRTISVKFSPPKFED